MDGHGVARVETQEMWLNDEGRWEGKMKREGGEDIEGRQSGNDAPVRASPPNGHRSFPLSHPKPTKW